MRFPRLPRRASNQAAAEACDVLARHAWAQIPEREVSTGKSGTGPSATIRSSKSLTQRTSYDGGRAQAVSELICRCTARSNLSLSLSLRLSHSHVHHTDRAHSSRRCSVRLPVFALHSLHSTPAQTTLSSARSQHQITHVPNRNCIGQPIPRAAPMTPKCLAVTSISSPYLKRMGR